MKKRLLIENDIPELDDFQKILLLNKRKISPDDLYFLSEKFKIDVNKVQIRPDGLLFEFDDLEDFLKFFFSEEHEEGSDGEWDAMNYDRMYYGNYSFTDDCYDRANDDWSEGYTLGYFCKDATLKLKELLKIVSPNLVGNIDDNTNRINGEGDITEVLDKYFPSIADDVDEIICPARGSATSEGARKEIDKVYCDSLRSFGIEKWGKWCFQLYFISWGNLVQLYVERGEFDEKALDVLLSSISKGFRHHLPTYYEMEYQVFDHEIFEEESCERLVNLMDDYIEKAREDFNPEYIKIMDQLSKLGLFGRKEIPGQKNLFMKVESVDPETLKVKYQIGSGGYFGDRKYGLSTVDEVIAMATQPGLFNPTEFRIKPGQLRR